MIRRLCALLVCLAMLASLCAVSAEDAASGTLLVTLGGTEIRDNNETLVYYLNYLNSQLGDSRTEDDEKIVRMYAMHNTMLLTMAGLAGGFNDEDYAGFSRKAQDDWNDIVEYIMMSEFGITDESPEEDKIAARGDAVALLADAYGYHEEEFLRDTRMTLPYETFANSLAEKLRQENPSLPATEEEIAGVLEAYALEDREMLQAMMEDYEEIGSEAAAYETFSQEWLNAYGEEYEFYYTPEGFRGILCILLSVDGDLMENWLSLSARLEESADPDGAAESAAAEAPVTADQVEAARRAILDSKADTVNEIMGKLQGGTPFADLVTGYSENAFLLDENILSNGYMVHRDSVLWPSAFAQAAAALEKPGDVSAPVVTEDGIYILYYLREIPGGTVPMTEELREELAGVVEDDRVAEAVDAWINRWLEENAVWTEAGEPWKYDQAFVDAYNEALSEDDVSWDPDSGEETAAEPDGETAP